MQHLRLVHQSPEKAGGADGGRLKLIAAGLGFGSQLVGVAATEREAKTNGKREKAVAFHRRWDCPKSTLRHSHMQAQQLIGSVEIISWDEYVISA